MNSTRDQLKQILLNRIDMVTAGEDPGDMADFAREQLFNLQDVELTQLYYNCEANRGKTVTDVHEVDPVYTPFNKYLPFNIECTVIPSEPIKSTEPYEEGMVEFFEKCWALPSTSEKEE